MTENIENLPLGLQVLRRAKGEHHLYGFKQSNAELDKREAITHDDSDEATSQVDPSKLEATHDENPELKETKADTEDSNDSYKKRYDDIKRYYDQTKLESVARIKALEEELLKARQEATMAKLPKTEAEIAEAKEKYPDVYNLMISVFQREMLKQNEDYRKDMDTLKAQQESLRIAKVKAELLTIHPDADDIKVDPKFADWYKAQSRGVKALLDSDDVQDLAKGIDLYKADLGIFKKTSKDKLQEQKEAATSISSNKAPIGDNEKKIWLESEIHAMPLLVFERYEKELDEARRDGRIKFGH